MLVWKKKLVLDQLAISKFTFFFILITGLLDIVLIEILPWSQTGVKN